jgi:adenylate cyclase
MLLETYVGPHASERILEGATTLGTGVSVDAAIVVCDIRDFTALSELLPRDELISLLNEFFDVIASPIEKHDGEILKFTGDGLLAIFRLKSAETCSVALQAVMDMRTALAELNAARAAREVTPLEYGIGVNVGEVMYGNIGSRSRLDFTVIGPAVNVTARLEALTKSLGHDILVSGVVVEMAGETERLQRIGSFPLRGVGEPLEVFAVVDTDA